MESRIIVLKKLIASRSIVEYTGIYPLSSIACSMQRVRYQSGGDPLESWQVYDLVKKKLLASFKNRNYESKRAFFKDWGEDNPKNIIAESLEKTNPELLKCTRYIWLKNP